MPKYTTAILVRNQFGVLNRVTSMFRRRQFNINSLTVSETESDSFSRITITYEGDNELHHQIVSQLYKLPDVSKVKELDSDESVTCELMLIKVKNDAATREEVVTMLWIAFGKPSGNSSVLASFPDAADLSPEALPAMAWAVENSIIQGTDAGTINPAGSTTRGAFAAILYRYLNK